MPTRSMQANPVLALVFAPATHPGRDERASSPPRSKAGGNLASHTMSIATELMVALEERFGPAEERVHTAIPPIQLGGGADVIEFHQSESPGGVVYVTAGASEHASPEMILCTRQPAAWVPPFLSKLAAASIQRGFVDGGTVPLGDGPFAGMLFTTMRGEFPNEVNGRYTRFLLAIGTTRRELEVCRSHGTVQIVAFMKKAKLFPWSDLERTDVAGLDTLGPSALARTGLSPRAREGLVAALNVQHQQVEHLRGTLSADDLRILAECYFDLGTLEQRAALIDFTQDTNDACLKPMWRAYVKQAAKAAIARKGVEHGALVIAICALDEDPEGFNRAYWEDLGAAIRRAKEISST